MNVFSSLQFNHPVTDSTTWSVIPRQGRSAKDVVPCWERHDVSTWIWGHSSEGVHHAIYEPQANCLDQKEKQYLRHIDDWVKKDNISTYLSGGKSCSIPRPATKFVSLRMHTLTPDETNMTRAVSKTMQLERSVTPLLHFNATELKKPHERLIQEFNAINCLEVFQGKILTGSQ